MGDGRRGPCLTAANVSVCAYPQIRRNRVETYVCDYGKLQQPCFVKGLAMDQQQYIDFVLRTVEERDIRFIRLWFTDVLGRLKSFAISPEDLEVAFEEGIGFDG